VHDLGLVVGKFAPLHRGHEALIAHAVQGCRSVLVLSYSVPEPAGCPAQLREQWLRVRCPQTKAVVLDATRLAARCQALAITLRPMPHNDAPGPSHWQWLAWCLGDMLRVEVDAMYASEPYLEPCAQYPGRAQGRPVAAESFDPQRLKVPISASRIRADPRALRPWLSDEVAASWPPTLLPE
jgi:HTH-type transcriptional regulator, transcriptional repressor of NAD biosynthesis genes